MLYEKSQISSTVAYPNQTQLILALCDSAVILPEIQAGKLHTILRVLNYILVDVLRLVRNLTNLGIAFPVFLSSDALSDIADEIEGLCVILLCSEKPHDRVLALSLLYLIDKIIDLSDNSEFESNRKISDSNITPKICKKRPSMSANNRLIDVFIEHSQTTIAKNQTLVQHLCRPMSDPHSRVAFGLDKVFDSKCKREIRAKGNILVEYDFLSSFPEFDHLVHDTTREGQWHWTLLLEEIFRVCCVTKRKQMDGIWTEVYHRVLVLEVMICSIFLFVLIYFLYPPLFFY